MLELRYSVGIKEHYGKFCVIDVWDNHENNLVFKFLYPKTTDLEPGEFEHALFIYFNYSLEENEKAKSIFEYVNKLSGKYPYVYICSRVRTKKREKDPDPEELQFPKKVRYDEDGSKITIMRDVEVFLKPYTAAKLCEMTVGKYNRYKKNLDKYVLYIYRYLEHKDLFDFVLKNALAPSGKNTKELRIFKELFLNPFVDKERIIRKYKLKEKNEDKKFKNYNPIRNFLRRSSDKIIDVTTKDEQLKPWVRIIRHQIFKYFKQIVLSREKDTHRIKKYPRKEIRRKI